MWQRQGTSRCPSEQSIAAGHPSSGGMNAAGTGTCTFFRLGLQLGAAGREALQAVVLVVRRPQRRGGEEQPLGHLVHLPRWSTHTQTHTMTEKRTTQG